MLYIRRTHGPCVPTIRVMLYLGYTLHSALYALMIVLGGEEDGVAGGPALGAVAEVDGGQASGYAA